MKICNVSVQHRTESCKRNRKSPQRRELYAQQENGLHHRIVFMVSSFLWTLLCHWNILHKGCRMSTFTNSQNLGSWAPPEPLELALLWAGSMSTWPPKIPFKTHFPMIVRTLVKGRMLFLKVLNFLLKFAFLCLSLGSALVSQYKQSLRSLLHLDSDVLNGFSWLHWKHWGLI